MSKWLWQWKWALVIAIFAGPAFAYFSNNTANRIERIMTNGAPFEAVVTGGRVERHRRGGRTYKLEVAWATPDGAPHSETLEISSTYANQIFVDDYVNLDGVELRYLAAETDGPLVVAPDGAYRISDERRNVWLGIGAGILGLILSPIWFWLEARHKRKQQNEIDSELERMRAGQAQT